MNIYLFVHLYLVSAEQTNRQGRRIGRQKVGETERRQTERRAATVSKCIKNMLKANRNLFSFSYLSELSKCEKDSNIEREKEREKEKKGERLRVKER